MAGITGAVMALPQGVAFAVIAGMPPEYGLYAGMIPAIIAAWFGSSWHLVSGPTTAASIVLYSVLSQHADPGTAEYVQLALTLTFMVGIIQLFMGIGRMGALINFISHSVVVGFTAGAALLIAANQVRHFFGMDIPRGSSFWATWSYFGSHISQINPYVCLVGLITLTLGIMVRAYKPRAPYMIIAMIGGSLAAAMLQLYGTTGIVFVGALPATLPPLSLPKPDQESLRLLAPGAMAVTILALTEAVAIGRALAVRSGQQINGNREFIGQGLSNIAGSFFSGYVATGSFNRSALNMAAGAKTPLAAILGGLLLMPLVLLVAPLAIYLPNAAMAGILFLVAWGLIDFHHIQRIAHTSRTETGILVITFLATLAVDPEMAILLGVFISLGAYLRRTSQPNVLTRAPDPNHPTRKFTSNPHLAECPQIKFLRVDGSLFFGAVPYVQEQFSLQEQEGSTQQHLVIIASGINFIDVAGAEMLVAEAKRRSKNGGLYLIRAKLSVQAALARGGHMQEIGEEFFFKSKHEAISSIYKQMNPEVCRNCKARIFMECQQPPLATVRLTGLSIPGLQPKPEYQPIYSSDQNQGERQCRPIIAFSVPLT